MGQGNGPGNGGVGRTGGSDLGSALDKVFTASRLLFLKAVACAADRTGVKAAPNVQNRVNSWKQWMSPKAMAGGFMLALFVFLHVLAASSALHRDFHEHDCHHSEESCVVTMLSHGLIEPPVAEIPLPLVSTFETFVSHTVETFVGFPISRLLPGRAPPAGLLA